MGDALNEKNFGEAAKKILDSSGCGKNIKESETSEKLLKTLFENLFLVNDMMILLKEYNSMKSNVDPENIIRMAAAVCAPLITEAQNARHNLEQNLLRRH